MTKQSKEPKAPPRRVLVEWLDAYTNDSGWKSGKSLRKQSPVLVRTIGYVVKDVPPDVEKKEPGYITVAASWVEHDDHYDGDCTIPYGMIVGDVLELIVIVAQKP